MLQSQNIQLSNMSETEARLGCSGQGCKVASRHDSLQMQKMLACKCYGAPKMSSKMKKRK